MLAGLVCPRIPRCCRVIRLLPRPLAADPGRRLFGDWLPGGLSGAPRWCRNHLWAGCGGGPLARQRPGGAVWRQVARRRLWAAQLPLIERGALQRNDAQCWTVMDIGQAWLQRPGDAARLADGRRPRGAALHHAGQAPFYTSARPAVHCGRSWSAQRGRRHSQRPQKSSSLGAMPRDMTATGR